MVSQQKTDLDLAHIRLGESAGTDAGYADTLRRGLLGGDPPPGRASVPTARLHRTPETKR